MEKICIECNKKPCEKGRRYCKRCYLDRRKTFYYKNGGSPSKKRYGKGTCIQCGKEIKLNRIKQKWCLTCFKAICSSGRFSYNNYENAGGGGYCWKHRRIAEEILNRKLKTNEVIHHLDLNVLNNKLANLIVISRKMHGRLHFFLREQRALLKKFNNEKDENCWKTLIVPMTTTWLETTGVKVIKLWEIRQSAAEPLS